MSRAKDQQILSLKQDLQELQEKLTALGEASKKSSDQMEPKLLQRKGEHSDNSDECVEIRNAKNPSVYCNTNYNELTHFLHYDSTCSSNKELSLIQGSLKVANFLTHVILVDHQQTHLAGRMLSTAVNLANQCNN